MANFNRVQTNGYDLAIISSFPNDFFQMATIAVCKLLILRGLAIVYRSHVVSGG